MAILLVVLVVIVVLAVAGVLKGRADKARRMKLSGEERWARLLTQGHPPLRKAQIMMRHVPSPPRCKLCFNPFGGLAGKFMSVMAFKPSRKNPNFCSRCCDMLPSGGAEVEVGVLFADVRSLGAGLRASNPSMRSPPPDSGSDGPSTTL